MARQIFDRVQETSSTSGTGPLALAGAVAGGFRTFASVLSVGDSVPYAILEPTTNAWEIGEGTYSAVNTLTRTRVDVSSAGVGTAVTLIGAASTLVFLDASAAALRNPASKTYTATGTLDVSYNTSILNAGSTPSSFALPSGPSGRRLRHRIKKLVGSVTAQTLTGTFDGSATSIVLNSPVGGECVTLEWDGTSSWQVQGVWTPVGYLQASYTASGAISPFDDTSIINSVSPLAMTVAAGGANTHRQWIKRHDKNNGAHTVTFVNLDGTTTVVLTMNSPVGGEAALVEWNPVGGTYTLLDLYDPGLLESQFTAGSALAGTEIFVGQLGTSDFSWTATQFGVWAQSKLQTWTTAGRPSWGSSQRGFGFNTDLGRVDWWSGTVWSQHARLAGDTMGGPLIPAGKVVAYAATVTLDLTTAQDFIIGATGTQAGGYTVTGITGALLLANPTGGIEGQEFTVTIPQDSTGSRAVTYGTNWVPMDAASAYVPPTAASSVVMLFCKVMLGKFRYFGRQIS